MLCCVYIFHEDKNTLLTIQQPVKNKGTCIHKCLLYLHSVPNHLHMFYKQVRVPRTKGRNPPPCPPKWLLTEVCPILKPDRILGQSANTLDWEALELTLDTEIEDCIDHVGEGHTTENVRPQSVQAIPRINTGTWRMKQRRCVGQRPNLTFTKVDCHAMLVI